jgi:hypothetical protein
MLKAFEILDKDRDGELDRAEFIRLGVTGES